MLSFSRAGLTVLPLGRLIVDWLAAGGTPGTYDVDQVGHHPIFRNHVSVGRGREIPLRATYLGQAEDHLSPGDDDLVRVANQDASPVGESDFKGFEGPLANERS